MGGGPPPPWVGLGRVVGVDTDVLGSKVAGQETGNRVAFAEVERDGVLGLQHNGMGGGFVVGCSPATVFEDGLVADPDAGAVRREDGAAAAGSGDEAAPVGVA